MALIAVALMDLPKKNSAALDGEKTNAQSHFANAGTVVADSSLHSSESRERYQTVVNHQNDLSMSP